jgi:hypothetical protein
MAVSHSVLRDSKNRHSGLGTGDRTDLYHTDAGVGTLRSRRTVAVDARCGLVTGLTAIQYGAIATPTVLSKSPIVR